MVTQIARGWLTKTYCEWINSTLRQIRLRDSPAVSNAAAFDPHPGPKRERNRGSRGSNPLFG